MNKLLTSIGVAKLYTHQPGLSLKQQTFFIKRLSFLIRAGIPLSESLSMLSEQTRSKRQRFIIEKITRDVLSGKMLSKSLSQFPNMFNQFSVSIVRVGESSGTLSRNLEYLAEELQKRATLRSKVLSALIYPALITFATIGIALFLSVYLFPKILPVFSSLNVALPFSTKCMMFLSAYLSKWGILTGCVGIALVVSLTIAIRKSFRLKFLYNSLLLSIPLFGSMVQKYNIANATRTMGLLLSSGLTLIDSIEVTAYTTANVVYTKEYLRLSETVLRGEKMSSYLLQKTKLFPDIVAHMISVGEKSGTLSQTLVYISELFDREVEDITKNISTLIEPALMILMGLLVGFIAISIITPIYGITQNLHA